MCGHFGRKFFFISLRERFKCTPSSSLKNIESNLLNALKTRTCECVKECLERNIFKGAQKHKPDPSLRFVVGVNLHHNFIKSLLSSVIAKILQVAKNSGDLQR